MAELFDSESIENIKNTLTRYKETIAVAESVTAGFLQTALASMDASQFFQGGLTAYNVGQKSRHLLVDPIHAISCNCVSEKVAREMALNVCKLFSSDWGIGITGYASPVPESNNRIFGYFSVAFQGKIVLDNRLTSDKVTPLDVQLDYVHQILSCFIAYLNKKAK